MIHIGENGIVSMLSPIFFNRDTCVVARELLGVVIRRRIGKMWLAAQIIETEAYYKEEKGSHASLGRTPSREAMFMPPGTIYMYYARGRASFNISTKGAGNAVLIKSAKPYIDIKSPTDTLAQMRKHYGSEGSHRPMRRLCGGQTLLCQALDLQVEDWNRRNFDRHVFYLEDIGLSPRKIIEAPRLGIPPGRDENLLYRFVDLEHAADCTRNPLTVRHWKEGRHYRIKVTSDSSR